MTHQSESTNVFTGPIREARIWSTNDTSSVSVSGASLILISVGITDQLYLHFLDKTHVLAASLSGNFDKIRPLRHGGKLLIQSGWLNKRGMVNKVLFWCITPIGDFLWRQVWAYFIYYSTRKHICEKYNRKNKQNRKIKYIKRNHMAYSS
jgi:hypothetical protein